MSDKINKYAQWISQQTERQNFGYPSKELDEGFVTKVKRFFRKATGSQERSIINRSKEKAKTSQKHIASKHKIRALRTSGSKNTGYMGQQRAGVSPDLTKKIRKLVRKKYRLDEVKVSGNDETEVKQETTMNKYAQWISQQTERHDKDGKNKEIKR